MLDALLITGAGTISAIWEVRFVMVPWTDAETMKTNLKAGLDLNAFAKESVVEFRNKCCGTMWRIAMEKRIYVTFYQLQLQPPA